MRLFFIVLFLFSSFLYAQKPSEEFIKNSILKYQKKNNVPGISVVIIYQGQFYYYPFGVKDLHSRQLVNAETLFELGSITKSFTAIALASEVIKRKVKLNDPAIQYLHGLKHVHSPFARVTLEQLVTHTAGFPHQVSSRDRSNYSDVVRYLTHWRPIATPGTHYQYSNYGFGMLGLALENATHQSYMDLLKHDILNPLNMQRTFLVVPEELHRDYAQGYDKRGAPAKRWPVSLLHAAGALRSNAVDMTKLLAACLDLPGTPSEVTQAIKLTQTGNFKVSQNKTQVMSWMKTDFGDYSIYAKNGAVTGFSTFMGYIPELKTGIVILANKNVGNTELGQRILKQMAKRIQAQEKKGN